jgi:putative transposase
MMRAPLPRDLRERIVRAVEGGASIRQAALPFEVSASAEVKLMRRVRETGSTAPGRIGGHRRPVPEGHQALLRPGRGCGGFPLRPLSCFCARAAS